MVKLKGAKVGKLPVQPDVTEIKVVPEAPENPTIFASKPVKSVQKALEPVVEVVEPLVEPVVEPLVESVEPVAEAVEPSTDTDTDSNSTDSDSSFGLEDTEPEEEKPLPKRPTIKKTISPELVTLATAIKAEEQKSPYSTEIGPDYVPSNSKHFSRFIETKFAEFKLPPRFGAKNFESCSSMTFQTYKYQEFIRDYMRAASPYRGILVYHGLGSGKTCSSIAAAEALYGTSNKKIIVMTPIALQENFINELSVCGFRHFHTKNFWVPFPLNPLNKVFAEETVGIPQAHIAEILKKSTKKVFWMPDFSKESNFDSLDSEDRDAIRKQIRAIIMKRITFIGYTGITQDKLKQIAVYQPSFFDDAIIIIDEVHNLTRLMCGKLEKYLRNIQQEQAQGVTAIKSKPAKIPASYEPVTTEVWKPKLIGSSQKYERAFLFYRLFVQAKNSKIIALSGTPIVNYPEEIGILANILHGYFHACEARLNTIKDSEIQAFLHILKMHPRIGYYSIEKATTDSKVFFTMLDEGYIKDIEDSVIKGVKQVPDASPSTIQEIYKEVSKGQKISKENFVALPLLPPTTEAFRGYFVDTDTFNIKNPLLFMKRMSGLVSYYKGAKEELMPKVIKDEIVQVPLTAYTLGPYAEARKRERKQEEITKNKTKFQQMDALISDEKGASSYRFRSRAICNFVFPEDIPRPFPTTKKEAKSAAKVDLLIIGDTEGDMKDDDDAETVLEEEEEDQEEDEEISDPIEGESEAESPKKLETILPKKVYKYADKAADMKNEYDVRVGYALKALRYAAPVLFTMGQGEENLKKYSPKFAAILDRMNKSKGSSLVYSAFKKLEGIGILGICLEANGFAQIRLTGQDTNLSFSPETLKSFRENPDQHRYIVYSGDESRVMRQTLINIFNMNLEKLPSNIAAVLTENGMADNYKGQVCRAFMITGAGAEGLSLKAVRTVHILEPYWNKVRTDQVKGRAVRICSHKDLKYNADPELNERTVEIFTYISIFSPEMIKGREIDATLLTQDEGMTSDEYILDINQRKDKITTDFIEAMKATAVDCVINYNENEEGTKCFQQEGEIDEFIFDPRINVDREMTDTQLRIKSRPIVAVREEKEKQDISYPIIKTKTGTEYIKGPGDILYATTDIRLETPLGKIVSETGKRPKIVLN